MRARSRLLAIRVENLPFGGTRLRGNAREGLHETLLDMTEPRSLIAKTCETTNRENRLPGNRSANEVGSFRGVVAQESCPCPTYRSVLADSGSVLRMHQAARALVGRD